MWRNININKQNVIMETGHSVLIACPHNSDYDGYCFWHPAKLVRDGRHNNAISISYTEDVTFRLKKYGKGKYNKREVIDEVVLGYEDIEEVFGLMSENICEPKKKNQYETYKPAEIAAERAEADESLIDNE